MARRSGTQLYNLLLGLDVSDRDEKGLIVSYAVLQGLLNVDSRASGEEIKWDEVRSVYSSLRDAKSGISANIGGREDPSFAYLCTLQSELDDSIQGYLSGSKELDKLRGKNKLVGTIFSRLNSSRRNYQDQMRRDGLSLVARVEQNGLVRGNSSALSSDYKILSKVLGGNYR